MKKSFNLQLCPLVLCYVAVCVCLCVSTCMFCALFFTLVWNSTSLLTHSESIRSVLHEPQSTGMWKLQSQHKWQSLHRTGHISNTAISNRGVTHHICICTNYWLWCKLLPRARENVLSENRPCQNVTLPQKTAPQTPDSSHLCKLVWWLPSRNGSLMQSLTGRKRYEFKFSRWWWRLFSMNSSLKCQRQVPLQVSSSSSQKCTRWTTAHTHTHTSYIGFSHLKTQKPSLHGDQPNTIVLHYLYHACYNRIQNLNSEASVIW